MTDRRTSEEIEDIRVSAGIYCGFDGVNCIAWKGDPAAMISVEPMMTIALDTVTTSGERESVSQRVPVIGPITRMAMALHMGLSAEESESEGLTAEAAERDLLAYMDDILRKIVPQMKQGATYPSDEYPQRPADGGGASSGEGRAAAPGHDRAVGRGDRAARG